MPLESKDILNYSLTLLILILTFFLAWMFYYVVTIIRDVKKLIHDILSAIRKFNNVVAETRDKLSGLTALIPIAMKALERIVEYKQNRTARKSKK